ncbi:translocation/assembly module TamB [Pseudomonas cavernicola]|uniref:Translocation/assembly module TamB n=1 Tax=Pseudomonas cavernicola TaxID=2320866 RepID=A0A418X9F4_9PSED|nr:translocation/assembly module TamB domain-containing protein [Pseudomonas cavernicola]RJG09129.1 translocation/assembly module TamB [Pseudomonas cavernicola]
MRLGLKAVAWALLGGLALLLLVLTSVLATTSGSRWVLGLVPGLQVENFSGHLGGRWSADRLIWQQEADRVEVKAPRFEWSPLCLAKLTLCLDQVVAEQVLLEFAPSTEESSEPLSLPDLKLPLALQLDEVKVGSLLLNGSEQLRDLQLAAHWAASGLQLDSLRLQHGRLLVDLHGTLQPQGAWPLNAEGSLTLPAPDNQPWQLALQVNGDLLKSLSLSADSSGYLQGNLRGEVQPLAENLPAKARISVNAFKVAADLAETLVLKQVELTADGDLNAGYQVKGTASLPGEGGAVALALQGRVDAEGAEIAALELSTSPEQHLSVSGALDWRESLTLDAKLDWQDFPWRRLFPALDEAPVALRTFKGEVHYQGGNYLGNFNAALDGPAGAFTLVSRLSGNLTQVHLPELQLLAGQGKANGQLTLRFAEGLGWDTAIDFSDLDPAYWLAELPGELAGPLRSKGEYKNQQLRLMADLNLKGRLRGQPALIQAQAEGCAEKWTVAGLNVRLGDNQIKGAGSLDQHLAGQLDLALPQLGQLWPQLSGRLSGRLDLAGTLQAPQGQLNLQGQQLALADKRIRSLTLAAKLDRQQRGEVELNGAGIHAGDTSLGRFSATGRGDSRQQQLDLSLQGPQLQLSLDLNGKLERDALKGLNWRGRLASGELQSGGQNWTLQHPAKLERLADGRVNVGAHCWNSGEASLCGEDQRLLPEPRLRYQLRNFPLDSLAQLFPDDFAWQGQLNADLKLDLPATGPNGRVLVDAGSGTLRLRDKGQWLDFPYDRLTMDSTLRPQRIDTRLDFHGPQLGELLLQAQIDPRPTSKPLTGEFHLSGLDLAIARPFVPMVERLAGHLNGSGTLSGGLLAPKVNGRLALADGVVAGSELPISLDALQLQASIAGESLQLDGAWRSGKDGQGKVTGQLAWGDALDVEMHITGSRLPVSVEPYANLEVESDLTVRMEGERLAVAGKVLVPRGKIEIRELPPSTVKVSDDAVIVGSQAEQGQPRLRMAMDIDVDVGRDKLSFAGFGLNADLVGELHIGDNLDSRGELNLNNGRYRAYGQRLNIRRARLLFAGPIDQPYLDIEAIRKVDAVTAGLRISGNAEQPKTVVFSEPAMSEEQALSYLVLGRPLNSGGGDNNMLAGAALGLGLAGSSSITGGLAQRLGIQDFQLDTGGTGVNTSVVASGNLSERLSLRYGVGVFEPASSIALRYELTKKLYLEAASGVASSLDIFYKRDF